MSFYFWLYILSAGSADTHYPCTSTPAHTHTYIKNICIHTQTRTYTVTFSLLSRQRVRGHCLLSACQREEGERGSEKGQRKSKRGWRNVQNGAPPPHHSIKTNTIRAGPYLSRLMLADRVAAI